MKNCFLTVLLCCCILPLTALEPGGTLRTDDLKAMAVTVGKQSHVARYDRKPCYEVVVFFDMHAPNAAELLRMMDLLPDGFPAENICVYAVAKNNAAQVQPFLKDFQQEFLTVLAENDKGTVYKEFAADELILPMALVARDSKVMWKGAPGDVNHILELLLKDKFSMQNQIKISALRNDLQGAIQAALPEVMLNMADKILELDPEDTIACQAKLYVYLGQGDFAKARAFLQKQIQSVPESLMLRILLLDVIVQEGSGKELFRTAFTESLDAFKNDTVKTAQILSFALQNAPFGWIPMKRVMEDKFFYSKDTNTIPAMPAAMPRREILYCQIRARLAYMTMDIDTAIAWQCKAVESGRADAAAKDVLEYYQSVKEAAKK